MEKEISWGCTPETGKLAAALTNLSSFPARGECELKYTKNKHLDRFRRAQNVVYDIFNNGLGNRGKELKILKLKRSDLCFDEYMNGRCIRQADWNQIERAVEEKFTPMVMAAAEEQGLLSVR